MSPSISVDNFAAGYIYIYIYIYIFESLFLCIVLFSLVIQKCVVQPPYVGIFNSFSPVIET